MQSENAEIVHRAYEAAFRKPKPDFATVNALFHSDHVFVSAISEVEGRSFDGVQGFQEWLTDIGESFESWELRVDRVEEIGADRLLVRTVFSARGRAGGVPVERRLGAISTVEHGKLTRTEAYQSLEQALEAAGLAE
jgi:ketosteroid isomerase-like protein